MYLLSIIIQISYTVRIPTTVITPWLWLTQNLTIFACCVFNLNNKNVNALIARELSGFTSTRSLIMNSKFFNTALGGLVRYWNFSFIVSELEQVNPDNSLAECVNL